MIMTTMPPEESPPSEVGEDAGIMRSSAGGRREKLFCPRLAPVDCRTSMQTGAVPKTTQRKSL